VSASSSVALPPEPAWPSGGVLARRAATLGMIAGAIGFVLVARVPVCPLASVAGIPCPGCGLTRATFACLGGHFDEALQLQPLVFFATPMVGVCAVLASHSYLKRGRVTFPDPVGRWLMPPLKAVYFALIAFWVLRFFGVWGGPVPVGPSLVARFFGA
jgi:hypothetical protein